PLDGKSGTVRLRMLFRPDYVMRKRVGSSTLAAPTRIMTTVAGAPIKGGVAVVGAVGHGVGKGASFLKRGLLGKRDESSSASSTMEVPTITTNGADGEPAAPVMGLKRQTGLSQAANNNIT